MRETDLMLIGNIWTTKSKQENLYVEKNHFIIKAKTTIEK